MDEETRRAGAIVASILLVIATICVYSLSWTLALAGEGCAPEATALICSAQGQRLAADIPAYGAAASTGVGLLGAWVWPRRFGWLVVGYAGLFGSACAGIVIASTGQ